jgi:hypothetical protein
MTAARNGRALAGGIGSLLPRHLEDLRRSGLDDRTIAQAGIESVTAPEEATPG